MEWMLLAIAVFVLAFNLDEGNHRYNQGKDDDRGHVDQSDEYLSQQVRAAEESINRVTDQAVLAMLDEVRAWTPGGQR